MKITLQYVLKDNTLNSVADLSSSLKKNIDAHKEWKGISIDAFLSGAELYRYYSVNINSDLEDCLRPVTYSFLHNCGIPRFVRVDEGDCLGDYSLIEELLDGKGKTLKRKFNELSIGREVVDKE